MLQNSRIFVAGHNGLVGSAICRRLRSAGFINLVVRSRAELDPRNQQAVESFFATEQPEFFFAAAKVGGILANSQYPADFIDDNLVVQTNVINAAWANGVKKTVVSRFLLRISQVGSPTDSRGIPASRPARANQ